jgi:putative FmdB family regulatory protein
MPTYDYKCSQCDNTFEQNKKIAERDSAICPECGSIDKVERLVGSPLVAYSVVTKGYGRIDGGFKEVLQKIHSTAGAKKNVSSFL